MKSMASGDDHGGVHLLDPGDGGGPYCHGREQGLQWL